MTYTMIVTVEVSADSKAIAHSYVTQALARSRHTDIVLIDTEVTAEREEEE